ncbi:hypothetical protein TSUD_236150 [Trifolium subterraneum]|nr:hypothetical protein TSUD_236150 [Trifolium subterraneum]
MELGNQTDHLALLQFKQLISNDPYGILDSWNSSTHFCNWHGIICSPKHQRVTKLKLEGYKLHGSISPYVGNLSHIRFLNLANNTLYGNIPQELGRLSRLRYLLLDNNLLAGEFPINLTKCSELKTMRLDGNKLIAKIPSQIGSLQKLQIFSIAQNNLSGKIPPSIRNLSSLTIYFVGDNNLVGNIPQETCFLKQLKVIEVYVNKLSGTFPSCLYNMSSLNVISVVENNFSGSLPSNMFHTLPNLQFFSIGGNNFSGHIPTSIANASTLTVLAISINHFVGQVPNLGVIPSFIGNLSQLYSLSLDGNRFEGNLPPNIGNCQKLQYLTVSQNNLKGVIPLEIFNISSLSNILDLSLNSMSGSLPKEAGMLKNIDWLDVSENNLSGDIPGTIGECISLEYLYLEGNSFKGTIPSSLASLKGLQQLDLSRNQLTGSIPKNLQNIAFLEYFNVSFNMLEGEVPIDGVFGNATQVAIIGNNKLCGGISQLHLPPCLIIKGRKHTKHHKYRLIVVIVGVVSFLLILSFMITMYWMRKRNLKRNFDSPTIDQLAKVSYQDLHRGTDGFSHRNLIGSGSFGSVYKGNLESEDNVVAVKVLNLQKKGARKSFFVECNALRNIRHRNLVKVLTCCSSTDYKGQEFKALVFDYMKNGSLEQWLHPKILNAETPTTLDLSHRLNIIIDVASALHYLHQECEQLVIHCDLKPSNVLLDEDMVAHVSDFGIARLVSAICGNTSTIGIKGSVGYAPSEYGMGSEVSTCGDMYSFGILMLEMLTNRRPTDEVFKDGQNLHNFVVNSFPDNLGNIFYPHLVSRDAEVAEDGNNENLIPTTKECLVSLFRIGLICSMESPKERMNIVDVTRELNIIRKTFLTGEIN